MDVLIMNNWQLITSEGEYKACTKEICRTLKAIYQWIFNTMSLEIGSKKKRHIKFFFPMFSDNSYL